MREKKIDHGIQNDSYSLDNTSRTPSGKVTRAENPNEVRGKPIIRGGARF